MGRLTRSQEIVAVITNKRTWPMVMVHISDLSRPSPRPDLPSYEVASVARGKSDPNRKCTDNLYALQTTASMHMYYSRTKLQRTLPQGCMEVI